MKKKSRKYISTVNVGDLVRVNFNNVPSTLCRKGYILVEPDADGFFVVYDESTDEIHHVYEKCTITVLNNVSTYKPCDCETGEPDSIFVFPYGKHRGCSVRRIITENPSYVRWWIATVSDIGLSERQKHILEYELEHIFYEEENYNHSRW